MERFGIHILTLGLLILSGNLGGRIARRLKIGEVIGQIFGGILIGPIALLILKKISPAIENIYSKELYSFQFIIFAFLALIAFGIGEELNYQKLKKVFKNVLIISLSNIIITFGLIFLSFYIYIKFFPNSGINIYMILILSSISIAPAPAITFALMNRYEIEGEIRNFLANILALIDLVTVILFSVVVQIYPVSGKETSFFLVFKDLFFACLLGFLGFGILWILIKNLPKNEIEFNKKDNFISKLLSEHPTPSIEMFLSVASVIIIITGISIIFHLPFLIAVVLAGALISNFSGSIIFDSMKIENIMPAFNLIFFALIGAEINFSSFTIPLLLPIAIYLVIRGFSQYFSTKFALKFLKKDKKITTCIPLLMFPQAGVAAVEAAFVASAFGDEGAKIAGIIIPSIVISSIFGVFLTEKTLKKWQSWTLGEEEAVSLSAKDKNESEIFLDNIKITELKNVYDREKSIIQLAKFGEKEMIFPDYKTVSDLSINRESIQQTVLGNGVVLPHCRIRGIDNTKLLIGIPKDPFIWGKNEKKTVLIFLLISPATKPDLHLTALSYIAKKCRDKKFIELITKKRDKKEIIKYIIG